MSATTLRIAAPLLLVSFLLVAMGWPLLRHYRRHGKWALVVHRAPDGVERMVARLMGAGIAGLSLWALLVALLGPAALGVWMAPLPLQLLGLGLLLASLALVVVAQAQMGESWRIGIDREPTALVESGLFGYSRNPIYTGLMGLVAGLVLVAPSVFTLVIALLTVGAAMVQARLEERHLLAQHGDTYRRYGQRVGRFLPGVGKLTEASH